MAITQSDIKRVKAEGFLLNRGTEEFSGRIITENGILTAQQMQVLSEAAAKYGNGKIEFTSRLTVECPGIHYDNIPAFQEDGEKRRHAHRRYRLQGAPCGQLQRNHLCLWPV